MFTTIKKFAKIILSSGFVLCGLYVLGVTIGAIFERGYEFLPCTIFLIGSIGMVVIGINGFKEVKNTPKPGVLTIHLPAK